VKKTFFLFCFLILALNFELKAQDGFYSIDTIQDIRITFPVKGWKHYMDSVFSASGGEERCKVDISINGEKLKDVGIRYKGFSSVEIKDIKNPLNIKLSYTRKNKNYQSFTSLKLSNVNYDPSFIREALSFEIARKYMIAPRANFANVYINDTLVGLYTSVESVNKKFIIKHFPTKDNSFFKGKPEKLEYPFGQNANLAHTHGEDSASYQPYYEMESDYGWSDLYHFIYVLNVQPDSLADVVDPDRALWMHAFNYSVLNLDSYIAYAQNYYLYKDNNGRFNTIPWDMNMSFGSFRDSDGSYHFTGLTIPETERLDPLEHLYFSVSPRPLMTKLFKNDTYRKMYLAHMRTIVSENFRNNEYYLRGKHMQDVISKAVQTDTNKFYPGSWFRANLDTTVGTEGSTDEFPGIRELVQARVAYLDSFPGFHGEPAISEIAHTPQYPEISKPAWITARVQTANKVILGYRFNKTKIFQKIIMADDGNHEDGSAGDGIYGAEIVPAGPAIQFYIWAENDSAGVFSPERAEFRYDSIQRLLIAGDISINEIMPGSSMLSSAGSDPGSPWIELCNNTSEGMDLAGAYLSDDAADLMKWQFPDTLVNPGNFIIILAGGPSSADGLHCNFSLNPAGGRLYLSNQHSSIIDSLVYPAADPEKSIGRYPNGWGSFTFMVPTCSSWNLIGTTPEYGILLYPNPASGHICIEMKNLGQPVSLEISNSCGQVLRRKQYTSDPGAIPVTFEEIDISSFAQGMYFTRLTCRDEVIVKSFIVK
jgi:hypothetical protein